MKLNKDNVTTLYSAKLNEGEFIEGSFDLLEYGWYKSGKAFIAWNGTVLTFAEAYKKFKPKNQFQQYDCFYDGLHEYPKNMIGLVRYLIDKYNK